MASKRKRLLMTDTIQIRNTGHPQWGCSTTLCHDTITPFRGREEESLSQTKEILKQNLNFKKIIIINDNKGLTAALQAGHREVPILWSS